MKLYFDENLPKQLAKGLNELIIGLDRSHEVKHILDSFDRGSSDENWINALSTEKACIITSDFRIFSERNSRAILSKSKVGIFFYRQPRKGHSYWEMAQFIINNIPEIINYDNKTNKPFAVELELKRNPKLLDISIKK